jgi:hypothetical protein
MEFSRNEAFRQNWLYAFLCFTVPCRTFVRGKVHYSAILKVGCNPQNDFTLWPNPAGDKVVVNIQSVNTAMVQLKIFDSKGTLVRSKALCCYLALHSLRLILRALQAEHICSRLKIPRGTLQKNKVFLKK